MLCETDSKVVGVRCVALVLVTICNEWNEFNGIALNYIGSGRRTPWTRPLEESDLDRPLINNQRITVE